MVALCNRRAGETPTEDEENPPSGVRWCGRDLHHPEKRPKYQPSETRIQMVRCLQKGTQQTIGYDSLKCKVSKE